METSFDTTPTTPCPPVLWRVVGRVVEPAAEDCAEMMPTPPGPPALTPDAAAEAWAAARTLTYADRVLCRRADDHEGTGPRVVVRIAPRIVYTCRVVSVRGSAS